MSDHVQWLLELSVNDGELENLKVLKAQMIEATQANEHGTVNYEWFISDDDKQCHLYEWYVDSAVVLVHLGTFGEKFADRFLAAMTPVKLTVYGNPNQEERDALAGLGAVHMQEFGGYARWIHSEIGAVVSTLDHFRFRRKRSILSSLTAIPAIAGPLCGLSWFR
jgi:quinol monooxygenase YgiN